MSRAEELAKQLYPDPKLEDYDDILVYRTDRDNASMGRMNVVRVYEQAEKDLKLTADDIGAILELYLQLMRDEKYRNIGREAICDEVLKRFYELDKNEQPYHP